MRQNIVKQNIAEPKSSTQPQESVHTSEDITQLRHELNIQRRTLRTTEEKLIKLQRLHDLMTSNFPGGKIFILNRGEQRTRSDGGIEHIRLAQLSETKNAKVENEPLLSDDITLAQIKRAFDGENVLCEVKFMGKFYQVTAVPLADSQNKINEVLCVIQDFTERKNLEEGLVNALEKEKELGELKSRFVTMASHEFRTPLTMILSSTFLLENATAENYETERSIHTNRIKRAVNNLTLILNEFLSLEKLEQNKVEVVGSDVNIPEFIQDTLSEMEILKREKQIIEYHHSENQSIARIDHHLLWSIVTNLISNSLKYSKNGDTIKIASEIRNTAILLVVKDTGIGIPDDEQQFIFGRFFRARNAINIEGTGLGLHIIQKYIHLLNGTITFVSQLDEGTTFTVILPIIVAESQTINQKLNTSSSGYEQ